MAVDFNQEGLTQRIKAMVDESCMTYRKFAITAGIDPSGFDKKMKGILQWTVNDINKICSNLNIRRGWLVDGEGQQFKAPDEILDKIPATQTDSTNNQKLNNAVDLFTDQALRMEKFIVMLSNEISEVRSIKEELQQQKEENKRLQQSLHDALFALRSITTNKQYRPLIAAEEEV